MSMVWVIPLSCLFMQIAFGLTHLCDPYFSASDSIIAGLAVSIPEASSDSEGPARIQETVFELQQLKADLRCSVNTQRIKPLAVTSEAEIWTPNSLLVLIPRRHVHLKPELPGMVFCSSECYMSTCGGDAPTQSSEPSSCSVQLRWKICVRREAGEFVQQSSAVCLLDLHLNVTHWTDGDFLGWFSVRP